MLFRSYVYRYEGNLNGIENAVVLITYPKDAFQVPKALRAFISTDVSLSTKEILDKPNYMIVPAALRELEKIELVSGLDGRYRLDHAVTATQKKILKAFQMDADSVRKMANGLSEMLAEYNKEHTQEKKMARPKKHTSMEEEIVKQEEAVEKSKAKYDA